MNYFFDNVGVLTAIIVAHVLILAATLWVPKANNIVELPTIQGVLLPAPPVEVVQKISIKKKPVVIKKQVEKHIKKVAKKIRKVMPPSKKSITLHEEVDDVVDAKDVIEELTIPPPPVVSNKDNAAQGAPVLPPKMDANALNNPAPAYPKLSRRLDEQGVVTLEVLILKDGSVGDVRLKQSSGFSRLDKTAIKAIKRWRYIPARRGNETIEYWYIQKLAFTLNS